MKQTLNDLKPSSLHDLIHEICNSCYSPKAAPNGDIAEEATQDILRLFKSRILGDEELMEYLRNPNCTAARLRLEELLNN
jgi:hypothetical protein